MAKSFCSGCKHWVLYRPEPFSSKYDAGYKFHYCAKLNEYNLQRRRELCQGGYKEEANLR